MNRGEWRKIPPPPRRAWLSFIVYHGELWNTSQPSAWQKQSHAPMSKELPIIQASPPLSRHPTWSPPPTPHPSWQRFAPDQNNLAISYLRLQGFIFQLFLRFPFVGAFDSLSEFPPAQGIKALGLTNPLKNASHRWDLSEFGRRGPADSMRCHFSALLEMTISDHVQGII